MLVVHSADWQFGLKAGQLGDCAPQVRERRYAAAERLVALAHERRADLVLLAGDTFDSLDVGDDVVARAVEILDRLQPIPVAVLPGNHDPLVAGSVWDRRSWSCGDHVQLLRQPKEIELLPGVVLYPCPLRQKRSRLDPTEWIPRRDPGDRRIRIGVAHGALDSLAVAENFPVRAERAQLCGLDYLAMGDWHGLSVTGRTAYPGTIEQSSFSEKEPGHVLLVELAAGDDVAARPEPQIEACRVGELVWRILTADLRDTTDVASLEERIEALGPRQHLLLRLRLTLRREAAAVVRQAATALNERLADDCFFLDVEMAEEEVGETELPPGLLRQVDEALELLLAAADGSPAADPLLEPFAGVDDATLRGARRLLARMAQEEVR